jgi:hypothetical protein
MKKLILLIPIAVFFIFSSCEKEEERTIDTNYNPEINPDNFSILANNFYFPLDPGRRYIYHATTPDGEEDIEVTILNETKIIMGVTCRVVRDVVSSGGQLIEDTYDWYAVDLQGNVWYFGEDVSNYEDGVFTDKDGSFEAGVDGALPGIIMMNYPILEMPYRQEYYFNEAEDWGKLVAKHVSVTTPYMNFTDCLKTADWNALEPDAPLEYKYYAMGYGVVREETEDGSEVVELIAIETQ